MRASPPLGKAPSPVPAAAVALALTLALAACGGDGASEPTSSSDPDGLPTGSAPITCKDYDGKSVVVKAKTITIRNNSDEQIYPVLATSMNSVNQWVQGCLRSTDPFPTEAVYKLYVNDGKGIPPDSEVTLTLPLYSQLSPGNYVTWWNGGRVLLADRNKRLRNGDDKPATTPAGVTCKGQGTACTLSTYTSPVQFQEDVFAQLSEYTFGDSIVPPKQTTRMLKPENVGYNISYVDHVYMPVAIGVRSNPYIGYSGSAKKPAEFRTALSNFVKTGGLGEGWPVYNMSELRLPGGYNIFAQRNGYLIEDPDVPVKPADGKNPPVLTVMKCIEGQCTPEEQRTMQWGQAVQNIQDLWGSCVDWGSEDISAYTSKKYPQDCPAPQAMQEDLALVKDFFAENHKKYLTMYANKQCTGDPAGSGKIPAHVAEFKFWEAIKHIYGWVPFNEGCGSDANKLVDTKVNGHDHAYLQALYIEDLQYNYRQADVQANTKLAFNPYVKLIHDDLDMSAYAFSVDDAVGFMSELGDGLVFTVGGTQGLENEKSFNYADGFSVGLGVPQALAGRINVPILKKYGVCSLNTDPADPNCNQDKQDVIMPTNSQISGFRVGTVPSYPLKARFTDMEDNVYTIYVREKFAKCTGDLKSCPTNRAQIVDKSACSVMTAKGVKHPKSDTWCDSADPNQQRENDQAVVKNHLSFPVPVKYDN
ncbi:hypothetical protein PIGHUM_03944 [Pigmentiphaga humi]|uniref:Uncharacterized protein n=1 Tax=Pigmentiphaga humi TaxID=2478468 RepID=A0A3P4B6C1_9BURK|nr:hypothetical protein [Pigmentiphaga humi]VCU71854.1 hypothetical protein PIGHUM_03944 [Pigmentiphaga humi]